VLFRSPALREGAEVPDHRHLREAQGGEGKDGVDGDHQQGGAQPVQIAGQVSFDEKVEMARQ